jgi:hypothetical protein
MKRLERRIGGREGRGGNFVKRGYLSTAGRCIQADVKEVS